MPAISASAPGKSILFGEHAVVYNRPAIAVPITQIRAKAMVLANPSAAPETIILNAPNINLNANMAALEADHPLVQAVTGVQRHLQLESLPSCTIRVTSTIPIAAGLGSGAAVSVAIIRALSTFLNSTLSEEVVSELAFIVEKKHHGAPSGIDNTVITYSRPIYFVKGRPLEPLQVMPEGITLVVGDSGFPSSTAEIVHGVNRRWQENTSSYEAKFDKIGEIAHLARQTIEQGPLDKLGPLMNDNHQLLQEIGVSTKQLDQLVNAALRAGAAGAKLSGAGGGGNMIALATPESAESISAALLQAGAVRTYFTHISSPIVMNAGFEDNR